VIRKLYFNLTPRPFNMDSVKQGEKVLLLWSDSAQIASLESVVKSLQTSVGVENVCVENVDRLALSAHPASKFDVCLSSVTPPHSLLHTEEILAEVAKVLKPNARLVLTESTPSPRDSSSSLMSCLTLSGFVNSSLLSSTSSSPSDSSSSSSSSSSSLVTVECRKPGFEVGESSALKLRKKKPKAASDAPVKKPAIWSLDSDDIRDAEVDLLDPDSLLDESDYVKPDPLSLKYDCGTNKAGKKKACKNCVCGLAEELEAGKPITTRAPSSACGSCYLGDAFRCASCPYLGMPAFKPGDKITLTDRQLKGDV